MYNWTYAKTGSKHNKRGGISQSLIITGYLAKKNQLN